MRIKSFTILIIIIIMANLGSSKSEPGAAAASTSPLVNGSSIIDTIYGGGNIISIYDSLGKPAIQASIRLSVHGGMTVGQDGTLYVSMPGKVVKVGPDGIVQPVAGFCSLHNTCGSTSNGDGGLALDATISASVAGLSLGQDGSLYIADGRRVRRINPQGIISTVAGGENWGFSGDGGPATQARFGSPIGDVDVDSDGTLYITDTGNRRIRKVNTNSIVTTIAGKDLPLVPNCWDIPASGNATDIYLFQPELSTIGPDNMLYVSSFACASIRKIEGTMSKLLVKGGSYYLNQGNGIAFGLDGTMYLSYFYGNGGLILACPSDSTSAALSSCTTIAGQPEAGFEFGGDGGPARDSKLSSPTTLAAGPDGSIYILDTLNARIRRIGPTYTNTVDPATGGSVSTIKRDMTLAFPAGAVTAITNVTLTSAGRPSHPTNSYRPTRFFFSITAESGASPITHFDQPYTLTLTYQDRDLPDTYNESLLNLFFWNGTRWQPLLPCEGCSLDTTNNRITARIDHLSDFALMEMPSLPGIYLPLVQR